MSPSLSLAIFFLPLFLLSTSFAASAPQGDIPLETKTLRLVFSKDSNYGLQAAIHKPSGINLISATESTPTIFRLDVRTPQGSRKFTQANASAVTPSLSPDGSTLTLSYRKIGGLDITASVTISSDEADSSFIWRIEAAGSEPSISFETVRFPFFSGCAGLGRSPEDDVLVAPVLYGKLYQNPYASKETLPPVGHFYPGGLAMQFTALYDREAGFYIACEDPNANAKALLFESDRRTPGSAAISFAHHFPEGSRRFATDFPIRLAAFQGDWYDAADIYRAWAVRQPWCERTLHQRADYPDWFKEPIPVFDYRNLAGWRGGQTLAPHESELVAREFIGQTRHPYVLFAPGWEHYGPWAGPEFFPPRGGEESFAQMISNLRERSNHFMHMFCVSIWVHPRGQETELYLKEGPPNRLFKPNGEEYNLDKNLGFLGKTHRMCPATEAWQSRVEKTTEQCIRRGIELYQLDLFPIANPVPCYGKDHPHPKGLGRWFGESWIELSRRARAVARKINPDVIFSAEEMCEIYIPYFETCLTREERSGPPIPDQKAVLTYTGNAPIFQHVYHDYITAIGDFAEPTSLGKSKAPRAIAKQFTRAKHIGVRIPMKGEEVTEKTLRDRQYTLDSVDTLYALGRDRGLLARMIRPPKAEVIGKNGPRPIDWRTTQPAIGAFRSPDGHITVLLSNSSEEQVTVRLHAPGPNYTPSQLIINGDKKDPSQLITLEENGTLTLHLLPFTPLAITYTASKKPPG